MSDIDVPLPESEYEPTQTDVMDAIVDAAAEEGFMYTPTYGELSLKLTDIRTVKVDVGETREFDALGRRWRLSLRVV